MIKKFDKFLYHKKYNLWIFTRLQDKDPIKIPLF